MFISFFALMHDVTNDESNASQQKKNRSKNGWSIIYIWKKKKRESEIIYQLIPVKLQKFNQFSNEYFPLFRFYNAAFVNHSCNTTA